jgi:hypothetical protein
MVKKSTASTRSQKLRKKMKEVTLLVPDQMVALIEQWAQYVPEMEIAVTSDCLSKDGRDQCFRRAVQELADSRLIRRSRDYAWIMIAIDQGVLKDVEAFPSHQSYIDYLKLLDVRELPSRTTLFRAYSMTEGTYPQWRFSDNPKQDEALRRKTIVARFASAYMRAKRAFETGNETSSRK